MSEVDEVLGGVPVLARQPDDARAALARITTLRSYPKGNILFYHGDPCQYLYVVARGQVKIAFSTEEGREVTLTVARTGEAFGLIAALDGGAHVGNAMTLTDTRLARIPTGAFVAWARERPEFQAEIAVELARSLRGAYERIARQSLFSVKQRLLSALVEIARAEGQTGPGIQLTFTRPTHQELADRIGSTRVVVSRLLKEILDEEDAIVARGRTIRLAPDALVFADDLR